MIYSYPNTVQQAPDLNALRYILKESTTIDIETINKPQEKINNRIDKERFILCKSCRYIITSTDKSIAVNGKFKHTNANPAGIVYEIGCFSSATGCIIWGNTVPEYTWFPGYSWCYAICLNCLEHLGWFYQSNENRFFGLILDRITEDTSFTD
jgi:hypothetical protein